MTGLGEAVQIFFMAAGGLLPWIVLAGVIGGVWLIVRRWRNRRR